MRHLVLALLFLMLVNEGDPTTLYAKPIPVGFSPGIAPFGWVQGLLFDPLPIKLRPFDIVMLVLLLVSRKAKRGALVEPMRNVLFLGIASVVSLFLYGIATGGDARAASWQVYLLLSGILFTFTLSRIFTKPSHFQWLIHTVIAAGLYRAAMCWYAHWRYIVPVQFETRPEYLTTHDDSVVWVISILALVVHVSTSRSLGAKMLSGVVILFLLGAIQWNTRRLAWVSLVMGFATLVAVLPPGRPKNRVKRALLVALPVIAIYVAVGWGRPERIFAPVQSLASVSTRQDRSTLARNAENLGLIATFRKANAITGTGWGHGYTALTHKYSIAKSMELWPYIPHNSVLGLLTYTGLLGFLGYWLAFPTAAFLNARVARMGSGEDTRNVGIVCSSLIVVCGNQLYGDMGIFSLRTMYLLATTYAVAMRLPVVAGVWPGLSRPTPKAKAQSTALAAPSSTVPWPR